MDAADPERFITSEKKNVLVDSFIKWRVIDARQFYVSVGGDERRGGGGPGRRASSGPGATAGRTCGKQCRKTSIAGGKPNASRWPTNCVRPARPRPKRSGPTPTSRRT